MIVLHMQYATGRGKVKKKLEAMIIALVENYQFCVYSIGSEKVKRACM